MNEKGHAVVVLVEADNGSIPLVKDFSKPAPRYWKFPGGRGEPGETAEEVGVRELEEETGLEVNPANLEVLHQEDRRTHTFTLFRTRMPTLLGLKDKGNDEELIAEFTLAEIDEMGDEFFPPHREVLTAKGLL